MPHAPSVLEAKLAAPAVDGLLVRPRLLAKLEGASRRGLTLLSAPCGYGKTSLLTTWSNATPEVVAWLTVDERDADPARLRSYVAEAVERARPGAGRRSASLFAARSGSLDLGLNELLADLACAAPLVLVLDDLQTVSADALCLEQLDHVVEHLPPGVRIVVGTRSDPSLALGRLRARGLLGEIRAGDLAFTAEEAHKLLVEREELDLGFTEIESLVERTEGWPVGLYLTGLWLREESDARSKVRELAAGRQWLGEYLTDEITTALDPATRDFLVRTSILTRLSGPLCDDLLGRSDSAVVLHDLSHRNLLVAPLDGDGAWFRVHRLFRELLALERERTVPGVAPELHRRAAMWFRENGYVEDAVDHLLLGRDEDGAAATLAECSKALLLGGRAATLLRLTERLSAEAVSDHPELAAKAALATISARRPAYERARWLAIVERARTHSSDESLEVEIAVSLTRAVAVDDDVGLAAESARIAVDLEEGEERGHEVLALAALGYALYLSGEHEDAAAAAAAALTAPSTSERPNGMARALGTLALLAVDAGRTDEAATRAREAVELARERGLETATSMHIAHLARSRVLTAKGRLRGAEAAAERGERLARMPDANVPHAFAFLVLAEARARLGRVDAAARALASAESRIASFHDAGVLPELAAGVRAQISTVSGVDDDLDPLSAAELSVLRLLGSDLSRRGMGRQLFLSVNTIKTHMRGIYRKLGVTSRTEAVTRARALGLVSDGDSPG
jgi:LuxR family maltose regulon positive regulatory protein